MEYLIVVYEAGSISGNTSEPGKKDKEVYRQVVQDLSIAALVELVNNGRRRTRSKVKDGATGTAP